jgi:FlaA1/EpsC-like NDP-sugar epimerase
MRARSRRTRVLATAAADGAVWALALPVVAWLRVRLDVAHVDTAGLLHALSIVLLGHWAAGWAVRLYTGRYAAGGIDESVQLAGAVLTAGGALLGADLVAEHPFVPRSLPLTATALALVLCWTLRAAVCRHRQLRSRPDKDTARRVVVVGAGARGERLVRAMLGDPASGYLPVAMVDDNPDKRGVRICGIPVRGTRRELAALVRATGAHTVMIAVHDAGAGLLGDVSRTAAEEGVGVTLAPPLCELFRPRIGLDHVPTIDPADLLGRRQVDTGPEIDQVVGHTLAGRRVFVTGAGGSIGAELCRQVHRFGPAELFLLDRDESALHAVRLSIHGTALLDSPDLILADIRDPDAVRRALLDARPDVVFHAAALKHVPMLERFPLEAWQTNVLGTLNVLDAATAAGVSTFVNISTDKAANPACVLGRSKRIGERLVAHAGRRTGGRYLSVRFGNVLGSRGSMLITFAEQLARGGPITVTDPEATRYFMTIPEAVRLVVHATTIGRSGEVLVLDMGAPVRIADVASQLMQLAGQTTQIVYTGLRVGEKLHEELLGDGEWGECRRHPAITHIAVPPMDPAWLAEVAARDGAIAAMATAVNTVLDTSAGEQGPIPAPELGKTS